MDNRNLLFVGGDLSGIQKFIYNITSKRAMVSLKGRSYYLKDFTEEVYKEILDIPEIKNSQFRREKMEIYCSGGKFYLQVPDTESIRNAIASVRKNREEKLWKEHQGQLSINIDFIPFVYEGDKVKVDGETGNIGLLWTKITENFNTLKNQKFKSLLLDRYQYFFEVQEVGGNVKVCQITGIEDAEKYELPFKDENGDKESLYVHKSVKEQIEKGLELRDKQHFKMLEEYADGTYLGILRMDVDGLGARFVKGFESMDKYKDFSGKLDKFFDAENGNLHTIQECYKENLNIVYAGGDDIFVVGRWDKVIDFAETVREEFRVYCDKVLKSDLSISGGIAIVHSKFPIAKAAQIAADAEAKAKDYNNGKKNAFCLFGQAISWRDELPDLLKQEKLDLESIDELLEFITSSIGSSIQEYAFVKANKMLLEYFMSSELLSKAILHQLMLWYSIIEDNDKKKKGEKRGNADYSYIWHNAYYLTRYNDRFAGVRAKEKKEGYNALFDIEKKKLKVSDYCNLLKNKMFTSNDGEKYFRLLSIAARWAELTLKITKKQ